MVYSLWTKEFLIYMKVKKTTLYFVMMSLLVGVMAFYLLSGSGESSNNVVNAQQIQGETQKVILGMKNFNYYPDEVKVNANQPVELSLDKSVAGCLRSFTIRDLGISKLLRTAEDKLIFTPKKGVYTFACSMGMGYGKLVVE